MSTQGRLIRWPEVAQLLNKTLSRSSVYRLEVAGKFPQRVQLGTNTVAWWEQEIIDWLESRARGPIPETERVTRNESSVAHNRRDALG